MKMFFDIRNIRLCDLYSKSGFGTNFLKAIFPQYPKHNGRCQTPPQICKQTQAKPTWGGRWRTAGNISTLHGGQCHPTWQEGRQNIQKQERCMSEDTRNSADITPMFPSMRETNGKQLKVWFGAAWEWVMHVEGCLWKPLEGWMCGSLRLGDQFVLEFKVITSENLPVDENQILGRVEAPSTFRQPEETNWDFN